MKTNMVLLKDRQFGVRIFVGDADRATDLAHFFQTQTWEATVREVNMEEHPRSQQEQELATALVLAYEAWRAYARWNTAG